MVSNGTSNCKCKGCDTTSSNQIKLTVLNSKKTVYREHDNP